MHPLLEGYVWEEGVDEVLCGFFVED